jgi:mono/diheme cytochrome c family protein
MTKTIQSLLVLVAAVCLASTLSFAQSGGEATYKAKCASCHGATGTPSAGMAKAMSIKPVSDPSIKALTVAQMIAGIKASPKMKSAASLPDAQLKEAVIYYKGLK